MGNFNNDKLYGEAKLIIYDINNNKKAEYEGIFENGKLKNGKKTRYILKNGKVIKDSVETGIFF